MRLETATPTILLLSGALLAFGACGDDGSSTPGSSSSADGTTTSQNTTDPSADSTMGPGPGSATDDPTTGMTTNESESESETATTTGVQPGGPVSFRFNSIQLTDPGAGLGAGCENADQVNGLLAGPIANDDDGDGFIDMSFVLDFENLEQADGAMGAVTFANAQCDAPDGNSCALLPGSDAAPATYTFMTEGTCLEATGANIEPGTGNTGTTTGPCFVTETIDATVVTSAVEIPLTDARMAAQVVGDPAGNLVSGTIEGFLSDADAMAATVEVFGNSLPLSDLLCAEQNDGGGWWMHMTFTAVTTTYSR